jgi:energy-coupling factor transporter ATP-binding protein EcfA2
MTIANIDRNLFVLKLNETLSPSRPIDTIEKLHGRGDEYDDIEKALSMDGRHVFIYGDRGVGKSSLAATLAQQIQSSDREPVAVSGSPDETFSTMVRSIFVEATGRSLLHGKESSREISVGRKGAGFKYATKRLEKEIEARSYTIAEATDVFREIANLFPNLVIVVDEFDRISDKSERNKFADLLKHIGDARICIRFIFTGIGKSLDDLLGAHGSAIRQLHTRELERLSWDGRWDIAIQAAEAFRLKLPRDIYIRLAQVSDGYPYYVHLLMEKILWRAFEKSEEVTEIDWDLFRLGLRDAIASINAELKRPYEKVLLQRTDDYEPVLWATANGEQLYSLFGSYYSSYVNVVMKQLGQEPMNEGRFRTRIKNLQASRCGNILERDPIHKEFLRYTENMLRGYVRMQAEAAGVELYGEEVKVPKTEIYVPARAKTGYKGSEPPRGY